MCDPSDLRPDPVLHRRHFLLSSGAVLLSWLLGRSGRAWAKAKAKIVALSLKQLKGMEKVGGSALVNIKGRRVLFVRSRKDKVHAFNPECTHKKCDVRFNSKASRLDCKCHNSSFDLQGHVLGGPAPRDLQVYPVKLKKNGRILIKLPTHA